MEQVKYRVYGYRWIVLLVYAFIQAVKGAGILEVVRSGVSGIGRGPKALSLQ